MAGSQYIEDAPLLGGQSRTEFSAFGLFWNIVKAFAGAGTFALPWAVMNAGLWGGIIGIMLVALLSNYTVRTLMKCGERVMYLNEKKHVTGVIVAAPSYPDIGRTAFGKPGAQVVSIFSACMCFGVCIAYFTLIGGNIAQLLSHRFPHIIPAYVIIVVLPVTLFLSCLTDLTKLAYTSVAGSAALLIAMGAVCVFGISENLLVPIHEYPVLEWKTIPLFLGGAAFLFCDHVILVPLANSCGDYNRFPRILDYAMIFVTLVNVVFAGLSYAFWREGTAGSVIDNLPCGSIVGDIVRIGISLEVLASFPLVANAGFQALETGFNWEKLRAFPFANPNDKHPLFSSNMKYYVFRVSVIIVLAVIASAIKNFGLLVSLVGSLTIASTGFVFPQVFYLKLFANELKSKDKIIQGLIIVFGVGMTVLGTEQSIQEIVTTITHPGNSTSC